jgi:integrase
VAPKRRGRPRLPFVASIYKRKGRPGFTLEWFDNDGRPHQLQRSTRALCKLERDRLYREQLQQRGLSPDCSLEEYSVRWFARVSPGLRPGSADVYAWAMDLHVLPALGQRQLRTITRADVKDLLALKATSGLARKTVANIRSTLHTVLAEAVEDGILEVNPAAGRSRTLRLTPTRAERRAKVKAFDADQLRRFLVAATAKLPPARRLMFRVGAGTGLRLGELLALQWDDVDLGDAGAGGQVEIQRAFTRGRIQPPKTGEARVVDVGPELAEHLRAYDLETKAAALTAGRPRSPWLFPSRADTPIDHNYIERNFKAVLKAGGLPPWFTPHSLRHTYATLALVAGESIYYVQRMLGHATIQMTVDTYGSWLPAGNPDTAGRIEAAAFGDQEVRRKSGRRRKTE